jgi:tetratricopeptide (TPR) repeat protein
MMGEMEAEAKKVEPVVAKRKQAWTVNELEVARPRGWKAIMANPMLRIMVYLFAAIGGLTIIAAGISALQSGFSNRPTPNFNATAQAIGSVITLTPTNTPVPTATNLFSTPTPAQTTPLALLLNVTYTPTPRYVNTPHPASEAFRLGLVAQKREDWDSMADLMQQTIDLEPDAADAYYYLGIAFLELDEPSKALNAFVQSSLTNNQFGPAFVGRAMARLAMDPQAEVSRDFQNAILRSPDFGLAYLERARYLISRGRNLDAAADLDVAETLLAGSSEVPYLRALIAFNQLDYEEARRLATDALNKNITNLANYRLLGEIEFAAGNLEEAADWLRTYNEYDPQNLEIVGLLAQSLAQTGAVNEALDLFTLLVDQNTSNPDFYLGRGQVYLAAGDFESAFKDLNQANRLRRTDYDILLALSIALIETGEAGNAYITLNETLPLASDNSEQSVVRFYRGKALFVLVENGDESSRPAAQRDLEYATENANILPGGLVAEAQVMLDALNSAP